MNKALCLLVISILIIAAKADKKSASRPYSSQMNTSSYSAPSNTAVAADPDSRAQAQVQALKTLASLTPEQRSSMIEAAKKLEAARKLPAGRPAGRTV